MREGDAMMSKIEEMLNDALFVAMTARQMNAVTIGMPQNVMISGLTGSGKTSITKQWAEDNKIILAPYNLSQDVTVIYEEDTGGILRPTKAQNPVAVAKQLIYNALEMYKDGPDFVLFLDDYHMATKENLEAIYYTIDTHKIINPVTGEEIELKNMLFTVAIKTEGLF